jgi:hypothetical protein
LLYRYSFSQQRHHFEQQLESAAADSSRQLSINRDDVDSDDESDDAARPTTASGLV